MRERSGHNNLNRQKKLKLKIKQQQQDNKLNNKIKYVYQIIRLEIANFHKKNQQTTNKCITFLLIPNPYNTTNHAIKMQSLPPTINKQEVETNLFTYAIRTLLSKIREKETE